VYMHIMKLEILPKIITTSVFFIVFICLDLSPLSNLQYLLTLDASHNKITQLLDFEPPKNLKEVDMSYNAITEMSDLSSHHYLMKLNLDCILCQIIQIITSSHENIFKSKYYIIYI